MKRTIAKIAAAAMMASSLIGASVLSVNAFYYTKTEGPGGGFTIEAHGQYWEEDVEEINKHVVDLTIPENMYKMIMNSPANPDRRAKKPQTPEEIAVYEKELAEFRKNLADTMYDFFGIEIGDMEQEKLYSGGAGAVKGDVNVDGKQNAKDVIAAMRIMLDIEGAPDLQFYLADINADGNVNAKDVVGMMREMLG